MSREDKALAERYKASTADKIFGALYMASLLALVIFKAVNLVLAVILLIVFVPSAIYSLWISRIKPIFIARLATTLILSVYIIFLCLDVDNKTQVIVNASTFILTTAVFIYAENSVKTELSKQNYNIFAVLFLVMIELWGSARHVNMTESFLHRRFVYVIFVFAAAVSLIMGFSKRGKSRDKRVRRTNFVIFSVIPFAVLFIILNALCVNINFVFDRSEPIEYECVIMNAEYINRRRGMDEYEFHVDVDGERIKLDVSGDVFYRYGEGDTVKVKRYEGALGEPYLILDDLD